MSGRKAKAPSKLRKWRNSPEGRLEADGATKSKQIGRRLLWLTREWQLPPCPKVGRAPSAKFVEYCRTHNVSVDWLLLGDLKGLQRMMQARRTGAPMEIPTPQWLAREPEPA